jgi:hypothetical protein
LNLGIIEMYFAEALAGLLNKTCPIALSLSGGIRIVAVCD